MIYFYDCYRALRITPQELSRRHRELRLTSRGGEQKSLGSDKNDNKNEIKTQVIYLYVCYPPGLVDGRPDKEHQKKSTIPLVILPRLRGRAHRF